MAHEVGGDRIAAATGGFVNIISNWLWNRILSKLRESKDESQRKIWQTGLYFFKQSETAFHTALQGAAISVELGTDLLNIMTGRFHGLKDDFLTQAAASIVNHYRRYQAEELPADFKPIVPSVEAFIGELKKLLPQIHVSFIRLGFDRVVVFGRESVDGMVEAFTPMVDDLNSATARMRAARLARQQTREE